MKAAVILALALLMGCPNPTTDYTRFFGTWKGSDSSNYITYTFNSDKTFSETTTGISTGMTINYSGTWDCDPAFLKLAYSTGFLTQCTYVFGTFNGKAELQLAYSTETQSLMKR